MTAPVITVSSVSAIVPHVVVVMIPPVPVIISVPIAVMVVTPVMTTENRNKQAHD
jgi:hypothetical protein